MTISRSQIANAQKAVCEHYRTRYVASSDEAKLGFAQSTQDLLPINGLRHPATDETSGWYIWCGEHFSEDPNFFTPLHTYHLYESHPEVAELLALPPGYRFLLAGDQLDVWYDESLLNLK